MFKKLGLVKNPKPRSLDELYKIDDLDVALDMGTLEHLQRHDRAFILYGCRCVKECVQYYERAQRYPDIALPLRQHLQTMEDYAFGRATEEQLLEARERTSGHLGFNDGQAAYCAVRAVGDVAFGWISVGSAITNAACSTAHAVLEDVRKTVGDQADLDKLSVWDGKPVIANSIWKAAYDKAMVFPKREFGCLCRLEGEYGEVDRLPPRAK
jgi:hypothetical protein